MTSPACRKAFDRFTNNARYHNEVDMEALKSVELVFTAGWTAALSTEDKERFLLEEVAKYAEGLTLGLDWNNGAAANRNRDKLIEAVQALMAHRESV